MYRQNLLSEELIAPCGMNCGLCTSYLSFRNELRKKGFGKTYCAGCRPTGKKCSIIIKRCPLLLKGKVKYCFECPEYPCPNLVHLDKRYRTFYHMSMLDNLKLIENNGIEAFLQSEFEKWQCPKCGDIICCHNGVCYHCELDTLKEKKHPYRWEE